MNQRLPNALLLTLAASLTHADALGAQDAPADAVAPIATKDDVAKAIRATLDASTVRLVGSVSKNAAENDDDDAFGGAISVMGMGGGDDKRFAGAIEVLRRKGKTLIASADSLPGVAVFDDGTPRRLKQTTVASTDLDVSLIARDLPDMLTTSRLLKEAERAEWSFVRDATAGTITATARLRARLIKSPGGGGMGMGMMPSMEPTVEHVETTLVLGADKSLQSARFAVVRFDPQSVMMRKLMASAMDGGSVEMDPSDFDFEKDKTPADLSSDIYALEVAPVNAASPRAERLFEDFVELTKSHD